MISPTAIAYIYAMFDCMGAILFVQWFCHVDNVITKRCSKQSHGCSCQGCKATDHTGPELSGTFRTLPPQPTPARTGTLRNPPEPSGTYPRNLHQYTSTPLNPLEPSETLRNLPEPTGTFRNLPPEPTPAHTGTLRNLPERASRTYTSTHRNSPEPAFGTYTSTHQNSPEPSSGTCSCDPHRHTPELIWAEDPTSSRCWGKKKVRVHHSIGRVPGLGPMHSTNPRLTFSNPISFCGIPNSSSIDIPCGQCYPRDQNNHMAAPVKVARQQTTPELYGTFRTLPLEPTPTRAGTLQNPPEPSETFRNQPFGTFRNFPEPTSWTHASIHRNPPKSSRTCLRNLHHFTPELSGTFRNLYTSTRRNSPEPSGTFLRNLLLRPAPAHTGAFLGWRPH